MASDWPEQPLGALVQNFDARRVPLSNREREKRRGQYPYHGATGVMDHVDSFLFEGLHLLVAEDGSVETPAGTPVLQLVDSKFWVNNHAHVLKGKTDNDTKYLYYALSRVAIRPFISGSVQAKLSQGNLNKIPVRYPAEKRTREAIAHVLGTLDSKIELNRRMNGTLNAMARALFKSWFIDFDPVCLKAEGGDTRLPKPVAQLFPDAFEESELGRLPRGWRVSRIGDHMTNFDSRRVPVSGRERAKRRGPYPYHGAAGIMDFVDGYLFDGVYLLIGEDGSVVQGDGKAVTQYVWGKLWVNNHAHVLQGKGAVSTEQLYLYFQFEPVAPFLTGAVQPKLSQGRMNTMPFIYAGENVCRAFSETVRPWFTRLRLGLDMNKTLTTLRDALLPKLISGEIRIKDVEKIISEVRT